MRRRDLEARAQRKRDQFAMRYASPSYTGLEAVVNSMSKSEMEGWVLETQANLMKAQADMWKSMMPTNRVEVVMLKSAVMMMDVMGKGVPKEWGEPTRRTKYLYYWSHIMVERGADSILSDPMWLNMPDGSYFVSWTNERGTERHHIGDAEKFGMSVSAPRICDAFINPIYKPIVDDIDWLGDFDFDMEEISK